MVSICVDNRAYWELPEEEWPRAKDVRGGVRTWAGVSFWVQGGADVPGVRIAPGTVKHFTEERRGVEQRGLIWARPILRSTNTTSSTFYLALLVCCSTQFLPWTHSKEKGRRIFQRTEPCQLMVCNFFIRMFRLTQFLTDPNNKAIAANYSKISIYLFEFEISSHAKFYFSGLLKLTWIKWGHMWYLFKISGKPNKEPFLWNTFRILFHSF